MGTRTIDSRGAVGPVKVMVAMRCELDTARVGLFVFIFALVGADCGGQGRVGGLPVNGLESGADASGASGDASDDRSRGEDGPSLMGPDGDSEVLVPAADAGTACSSDTDCPDAFCDYGICATVNSALLYGTVCLADASSLVSSCGAFRCTNGRCRSCSSNADCQGYRCAVVSGRPGLECSK